MTYNKVILAGTLTRDPELRYTQGKGTAIAKFAIALNYEYKTASGEKRKEVAFVDVDVIGPKAEVIKKYFSKGKPIMLEGRLKQDTWEDKETHEKRSKLGVVLEGFTFLGSKNDTQQSGEQPSGDAPGTTDGEEPQF